MRIVHGGEHGRELLPGLLHGILGIAGFLFDQGDDALHKILIFHKHGMGLEEDLAIS